MVIFFLISILLSSYLDFCEEKKIVFKKNNNNNEDRYGENNHSLLPPVITLQVPLISSLIDKYFILFYFL